MSSFDQEFRKLAAQQQARDAEQLNAQDRRRRGAEAAAGDLSRLLQEFLNRLSAEGVEPCQVRLPHWWSPAGYVLGESHGGIDSRLIGLSLLTVNSEVYVYSDYNNEETVPITADSLLSGRVNLGGRSPQLSPDGELYVDIGNDHEQRVSIESYLADIAVRIVAENTGQRQPRSERRAPAPKTRLEEKIDGIRTEMNALNSAIESAKARNAAGGKDPYSRGVGRMANKSSRLLAKYDRLVQRNRRQR
ncbi:hypothetical protein H7J88_12615 [Mycolicibacterium flavescens]|nr:hypothetical protein [Mycolicibacterium flavescens]MCV7280492.1 hypothetical protein [Mycolicibacterium flavescens]